MALTQEQHDNLRARLEALVSEYAAASQRNEAIGKLRSELERIAIETVASVAIDALTPAAVEPAAPASVEPDTTAPGAQS